jgi:hypothetical protein
MAKGLPPPIYPSPLSIIPLLFYGLYILNWHNTRILLQERSAELGRRATLEDVPDSLLDWLADQGFEWVWFLGMWQREK